MVLPVIISESDLKLVVNNCIEELLNGNHSGAEPVSNHLSKVNDSELEVIFDSETPRGTGAAGQMLEKEFNSQLGSEMRLFLTRNFKNCFMIFEQECDFAITKTNENGEIQPLRLLSRDAVKEELRNGIPDMCDRALVFLLSAASCEDLASHLVTDRSNETKVYVILPSDYELTEYGKGLITESLAAVQYTNPITMNPDGLSYRNFQVKFYKLSQFRGNASMGIKLNWFEKKAYEELLRNNSNLSFTMEKNFGYSDMDNFGKYLIQTYKKVTVGRTPEDFTLHVEKSNNVMASVRMLCHRYDAGPFVPSN